jgi:hypothetical protein
VKDGRLILKIEISGCNAQNAEKIFPYPALPVEMQFLPDSISSVTSS